MIKNTYEKYGLPKLLDTCCSTKPINYQREKVVPNASGTVLEIGLGSGLNIPFYNLSKINKIYGLDPSTQLCKKAIKKAEEMSINIDFLFEGAEEIKLKSNSIDTVVITYTLCSIPNPIDALKEIKRVMRRRISTLEVTPYLSRDVEEEEEDVRKEVVVGVVRRSRRRAAKINDSLCRYSHFNFFLLLETRTVRCGVEHSTTDGSSQ